MVWKCDRNGSGHVPVLVRTGWGRLDYPDSSQLHMIVKPENPTTVSQRTLKTGERKVNQVTGAGKTTEGGHLATHHPALSSPGSRSQSGERSVTPGEPAVPTRVGESHKQQRDALLSFPLPLFPLKTPGNPIPQQENPPRSTLPSLCLRPFTGKGHLTAASTWLRKHHFFFPHKLHGTKKPHPGKLL